MSFDETLANRVRQQLARRKGIETKLMFGGIGFLVRGNLLVAIWKNYLIVRLGPEGAEAALAEPHVRKFDITGRAMKGWVMVASAGLDDDATLSDWIRQAWKFVGSLPSK